MSALTCSARDGVENLTVRSVEAYISENREVLHTGSEAPDRSSFHAGANRVPAGDPYIVISNDFWRNHFGGDPGLVGRELVLNGHSYTVIGVAPAGFRGTNVLKGPDVWLPMMMHEQLFTSMPQMMFGMRRALQFDSL